MNNWPYRPLSDFLKEREGRYKPNDPKISDYKRLDKINFSGLIHVSKKPSKTNMIIVRSGDLVISGINVAKGALAIYQGNEPVVATIHYSSYTFDKDKIDIEFLKRFLKSPAFIIELQNQVKGGIKTEIKPKQLLPLKLRIPELPEQKIINQQFVAIETEISSLSNEVSTQSSYLTKLRQTILQEAIEGKLTADWRKENTVRKGDPDYDAEALLDKIRAEKEKLFTDGKIKKQKPIAPIKLEEVPFDLPEGWVWCRLGEICNIVRGSSPRPKGDPLYWCKKKTEYHWITIADFTPYGNNGTLTGTKGFLTKEGAKHSRYIEKGDLLVACSGVGSVGRSIQSGITGYIYDGIIAARKIQNPETKSFLKLFLEFKEAQIYSYASGANWLNINTDILNNYLLGLPPLKEQSKIVERVKKLFFMSDELGSQVSERKNQSAQLMQAVLREAFEG